MPPCSALPPTQCSQYFHEVQLTNLKAGTTYYYQIPGGNGTWPSDILSFRTANAVGDDSEFSVLVINDMGYTNAKGTHLQLTEQVQKGAAFAWHGGDITYADDWFYPQSPCAANETGTVCYNGTSSTGENPSKPNGVDNPDYYMPLPAGEKPADDSPWGGDSSTIYENNWDIWQQWMNSVTQYVPYMVNPGNHEAACVEGDTANGTNTAILVDGLPAGTTATSNLTYYSCPVSQRNFTAYSNRFRMPGNDAGVGGRSNFWYSFDYGLAHFISFSGETDYYNSPELPFLADIPANSTETMPMMNQTKVTNSGPFGNIDRNQYQNNTAYEQYQWLKKDLASVDRTKTPWVFAMSHRPMYSSSVASYQAAMRAAFEQLFVQGGVDLYMSGHIHWYERTYPIMNSSVIDYNSVIDNHTYHTNTGHSMTHIVNGQAGNVENHSTLGKNPVLNITAVLDQYDFGFSKITVMNATTTYVEFIKGADGSVGDYLYLLKN